MNKRFLKAILQRAWYPQVMKCGLCHGTTHELIRVSYQLPHVPHTYRASACPDCVRDMCISKVEDVSGIRLEEEGNHSKAVAEWIEKNKA